MAELEKRIHLRRRGGSTGDHDLDLDLDQRHDNGYNSSHRITRCRRATVCDGDVDFRLPDSRPVVSVGFQISRTVFRDQRFAISDRTDLLSRAIFRRGH